jgi:hypothetical protein
VKSMNSDAAETKALMKALDGLVNDDVAPADGLYFARCCRPNVEAEYVVGERWLPCPTHGTTVWDPA